jgi:hypothetical protein
MYYLRKLRALDPPPGDQKMNLPAELLEEDVDVEAALPVQQVDLAPLLSPLGLPLLTAARGACFLKG